MRKVVYLGLDYEIMFCSRRCDSCVRVFARITQARLHAAAAVAVYGGVKLVQQARFLVVSLSLVEFWPE